MKRSGAGALPLGEIAMAGRQLLPQMADVSLYRWDCDFRVSTVMGMAGTGGIGLELMSSLHIMQCREVSAILIVILVMVTAVDEVGSLLRRRFK
jgi:phosphonate transport system permease protein